MSEELCVCPDGRHCRAYPNCRYQPRAELIAAIADPITPPGVKGLYQRAADKIDTQSRQLASLLAQVKAWEDKAGEVPEYPVVFTGTVTDGTLRISGEWVSQHCYDLCRDALVVARKENEDLRINNSARAIAYEMEDGKLIERATAAEAESAGMREALRELLEALEHEAKCIGTRNTAMENYSNPKPEIDAATKAMVAASEASRKARALLAPRREKAAPDLPDADAPILDTRSAAAIVTEAAIVTDGTQSGAAPFKPCDHCYKLIECAPAHRCLGQFAS